MSAVIIPREDVHTLAEACSEAEDSFKSVANRLLREQKRLTNFIQKNMPQLDVGTREVVLYMFAVSLRVFEQYGGRMRKANGSQIQEASSQVQGKVAELMPFDANFPSRVRQVEWRAQPHLLDEILWALFEREEKEEGEVDVPHEQGALIFLVLWVAVEALEVCWTPSH